MRGSLFVIFAGAVLAASARPASADEPSAGILVTGSGVVRVRPSVVEIGAQVSGKAELAADAMVKYKDAKRRALKAIEDLKIANLTVAEEGLTVGAPGDMNAMRMAMMNQGGGEVKMQFEVGEQFRISVQGIDKLDAAALIDLVARIMDAAKDAGLSVGASGPKNYVEMQMEGGKAATVAMFVVPDAAEAKKKASALAMADARAQAQQLADLAQVRLGAVRAIQESASPAGEEPSMMEMFYGRASKRGKDAAVESRVLSPSWDEVPVAVHLRVQFEIVK